MSDEDDVAKLKEEENDKDDEAGDVNVPEAQMPETNTTKQDVDSSTKKLQKKNSAASTTQFNSMQETPSSDIASGNSSESVSREDSNELKNELDQKIENLATDADENSSLDIERENLSKLENKVAQLNDKLEKQNQQFKDLKEMVQNMINNQEKLESRQKATEERVVWIMYIISIFIAVCAVYFGLNFKQMATKPQVAPAPKIEFSWKHVEQFLDKSYPQLIKTENVISTLDLAYHRWFKRDDEPVVLIIAGKSSGQFLEDLTSFTSRKILRRSSIIYVDSNTAKADLYEMFDTALGGSNDITVAGVRGIEKLMWDAPLVLHAIVDGANSPYPKALILLAIEEEIKGDCEQGIEKLLNSRWTSTGGTGDNVSPILARIQQFHICI